MRRDPRGERVVDRGRVRDEPSESDQRDDVKRAPSATHDDEPSFSRLFLSLPPTPVSSRISVARSSSTPV